LDEWSSRERPYPNDECLDLFGISRFEAAKKHESIVVKLAHEPETNMISVVVPGPNGDEGVCRVAATGQSYM
jgi:hypothetical protein